MEPQLPRSAPNLDKVTEAFRDLEQHTVEVEPLQLVQYNSIVVLEFLGNHPQTKRVKLVEDKSESTSDGAEMLIDTESEVGKKIYRQIVDDAEIVINDHTKVRILEIIDPEPTVFSEPQ